MHQFLSGIGTKTLHGLRYQPDFVDLEAMIDAFSKHPDVIGILEYGGRKSSEMAPGGDYDFTLIFEASPSTHYSGLHFHINGIPVDCMLLSLTDFDCAYPENPFLLAHLESKILYDRDGRILQLLCDIQDAWGRFVPATDSEITLLRFTFRHILDKLEHRLHEDPLYSRYFTFSSLDYIIECYARLHCLSIGKARQHLSYMAQQDQELYGYFNEIYTEASLDEQYRLLKRICERVLIDIGGLWQPGEVLFHWESKHSFDVEEGKRLLAYLFSQE